MVRRFLCPYCRHPVVAAGRGLIGDLPMAAAVVVQCLVRHGMSSRRATASFLGRLRKRRPSRGGFRSSLNASPLGVTPRLGRTTISWLSPRAGRTPLLGTIKGVRHGSFFYSPTTASRGRVAASRRRPAGQRRWRTGNPLRPLSSQLCSTSLHQRRRLTALVALSSVSGQALGRRDPDELAVVVMSYLQPPVGWWQDAKGTMQPPGSFLAPSLRVPSGNPGNVGTTAVTAPSRFKRWVKARHDRRG